MTLETVAKNCVRHADRPGAAICMSCRAVICQECTTTWEGICHCAPCLAAKARPRRQAHALLPWIGLVLTCAVLMLLAVEAAVTTGTLIFGS